MMARVERHIVDIDPRMNVPLGRRDRHPRYNEILELKELKDFKNGRAVRVTVCDVDPEGEPCWYRYMSVLEETREKCRHLTKRLQLGRGRMCRDQIH
jgi:hypothetical protein